MSNLYGTRDIIEQGEHYARHVDHMTSEGLHSKSDIAAELAHRDIEIENLHESAQNLHNAFQAAHADTTRLEWLIVGGGKRIAAHVGGSDQYGWRVCDCSNGLTIAGKGKTWREAIDDAMSKEKS